MKYVFENCENIEASGAEVQTKEFATTEEAMEYAETAWDKLSDSEKKSYDSKNGVYMAFESVNEDEEAVDHLDAKRILWSAPIPYYTDAECETEAYATPEARLLAEVIRAEDSWSPAVCSKLAELAGMEDEYTDADGESFENVLFRAAQKLCVTIV